MPPFLSFVAARLGHHCRIAWSLSHVLLVEAGSLGGVNFAGGNGFAVAGLQVELKTGCGLLNYEFAHVVDPPV